MKNFNRKGYMVLEHNMTDSEREFIIVGRNSFKWMKIKKCFGNFGMPIEAEDEDEKVLAYNYWNGRNWASIIIDAEYDTFCEYERVNEELEIDILNEFFRKDDDSSKYKFVDHNLYQNCWYERLVTLIPPKTRQEKVESILRS